MNYIKQLQADKAEALDSARSIGPKDSLLALWVSQRELLEENAAEHQRC